MSSRTPEPITRATGQRGVKRLGSEPRSSRSRSSCSGNGQGGLNCVVSIRNLLPRKLLAASIFFFALSSTVVCSQISWGDPGGDEPLGTLSEKVRPSVVEIIGTLEASGDTSYGTGFAVREPNLILTNAHVVRGVSQVMVRTWEGALLASVEVLHVNETVDLALLRVTGLHLRPLPLASESVPEVGVRVVAVGHPRGYEFTVSDGIVSATRRLEEGGIELIQTTAPISPGSSGGPLFDLEGRVVGVCSLTLTEGQNINFAVPVREVGPVIAEALRIEKALQKEDPSSLPADALAHLVRRHREAGDLARAHSLVRRALMVHPGSLPLLAEAAEVAWSRGEYQQVKNLVDELGRLAPDFAPGHELRAAYLAQMGQCEDAIGEARISLAGELDQRQAAEAHAVLAECLGRMGQIDEALTHVDQALASGEISSLPDYHALKAFLLHAQGRAEEADSAALAALEAAQWDPLVVAALRERGLPRLVEVVSFKGGRQGDSYIVRGVIRNRGPVPVEKVIVTAEGFDGAELMVATGSATVSPVRLVPGQSGAFKVLLEGDSPSIEKVMVRVVDYAD